MSYSAPATRDRYQTTSALTASQPQLLVMLYDATHRCLVVAAAATRERRIEDAHRFLRRAEMIIGHLEASLDFEHGGSLAGNLASLFNFCLRHLTAARIDRDADRIEEVDGLLMPLRDAWAQVGAAGS